MGRRNLTISIEEESYQAARVAAAKRGISVSELVREYFRSLGNEQKTHEERVAALLAAMDAIKGRSAENIEHDRDKLHER
ncbi:MAG: DUF6364 family protein [Oceanipulchritudo sp.]|jgi:hypothetical protein